MDRQALYKAIKSKRSYLCVGLDSDLAKIPSQIRKEKDPIFEFNRRIIDVTAEYAVAYKPNIAFYESLGSAGWDSLARTMEYIPEDIFTIADAKRGDIGNTSRLYAKAFFEKMNFDSITVAPYMGEDSVIPFLEYEGKWVILLAHTSNPGSADFQLLEDRDGKALYENVLLKSSTWATPDQLMFVVGATRADKIAHIRSLVPDHFFLVPGVGAQGGDLEAVSREGFNAQCGLLVNSSRGIIFADQGKEFASTAARKAGELRDQMSRLLDEFLPDV